MKGVALVALLMFPSLSVAQFKGVQGYRLEVIEKGKDHRAFRKAAEKYLVKRGLQVDTEHGLEPPLHYGRITVKVAKAMGRDGRMTVSVLYQVFRPLKHDRGIYQLPVMTFSQVFRSQPHMTNRIGKLHLYNGLELIIEQHYKDNPREFASPWMGERTPRGNGPPPNQRQGLWETWRHVR